MPKSKVRKKSEYTVSTSSLVPTKITGQKPSSRLYIGFMLGLIVLGLAWIILFYLCVATPTSLSQPHGILHWMAQLGNWNFLIGIGIIVAALLMSLGWK